MHSAMSLARDLGLGVQCAIADTPAGAQAFAMANSESPVVGCLPGEERERLKDLSLPSLLNLEGLEPWKRTTAVESMVTFFMMLGFRTAGDLSRFTLASLQERWGEVGELMWKRMNASDRQPISPLEPTTPLEDYVHLDFPISLVSLLLHQSEKSLDYLFARLQGRRLFAQKLVLVFHCEYSKAQHRIEIEPNTPNRDRDLFVTLLEHRLSALDLENPVRDFEMSIVPCPEKARQLDFFEPRTTDEDRLQTLMNLLTQSSLKPGLYQIEPSILPEQGWRLVSHPRKSYDADADAGSVVKPASLPARKARRAARKARVAHEAPAIQSTSQSTNQSMSQSMRLTGTEGAHESVSLSTSTHSSGALSMTARSVGRFEMQPSYPSGAGAVAAARELSRMEREIAAENAVAVAPRYGESVMRAPRPTRILRAPLPLALEELQRLKILSRNPIERLEGHWWETDTRRDYYFAVSPEGQCLWIYQDMRTEEYFLHGYFD